MSRPSTASTPFEPSGFFVLRTPLLPLSDLAGWAEGLEAASLGDTEDFDGALDRDRQRLRERLQAAVSRPELRDAIFVASPSLDEALEIWQKDPGSERARSLEPVIVSYFARAATRPTPFGLFAGSTTGHLGPRTSLGLPDRRRYARHSRLDMDYLWALTEAVEGDRRLRRRFVYRPNSSLYEAAGRFHLAEARLSGTTRSYHLVAVDKTPYLLATLERAQRGATLDVLAGALVDEEVTHADAEEYLDELVDSQILVSDVRPQVTGEEPVEGVVAALRRHGDTAALAERLDEARSELEAIDEGGPGAAPDRYRAVASLLGGLPAEPELSRLVQVDLLKPTEDARLGPNAVNEIARAVRLLHQLGPPRPSGALRQFREEFEQRYETREVPLVEVLDEETGIGFERSRSPLADASPLLAGLPLGSGRPEGPPWGHRDALLLQKLTDALAEGSTEIRLERSDLEGMAGSAPPLPDAFEVVAALAAESDEAVTRGAFRVLVQSVSGPSGARLLGRFCHQDPGLHRLVVEHLLAEEARQPHKVFAEVVHLPEGRVGNILCRPLLRDYEIPYLGRSGAGEDRQLPVTDLLVSLRGDRIVLRSHRLGREVVPRLTTAHNYGGRSLGVYRFLCALQHQGVAPGLTWDWGPLASAGFLPRVVSGRAVLARARWNLGEDDIAVLRATADPAGFAAVQAWRARRQLPRHVALADGDNELVIDLDNVLSVEALAHHVRGRPGATLVELFPGPGELCVRGPEGPFVHQLVVPFVRSSEPEAALAPMAAPPACPRRFPPGSEWLYAKLYGGVAAADQVLHQLGRVAEAGVAAGAADRWFFIRFADPEPHLRLRLHGPPERLHADVLPALETLVADLVERGLVWRFQLDTYEREVERYGGTDAISLAERIFDADSRATLAIVRSLAGDAGADLRWRLALRGVDLLFDDLGLTLDERRTVARRAREGYGRELGAGGAFHREVGARFRNERPGLEALLGLPADAPTALTPGLQALDGRSAAVRPIAGELRALAERGALTVPIGELALSFAHMHVNRVLRSAQRASELVLYEFLDRLYASSAARRRSPAS